MDNNSPDKRRKILVIVNKLSRGGAEKQLLLIINYLKDRYEFNIVSLYRNGDFELPFTESGIPIMHLGINGSLFRPSNLYKILRLRLHPPYGKPDLIHSWLFHSNLVASILKIMGASRGLIVSIRGSNFWYKKQHFYFSKLICRACNLIVTNSLQLDKEIRSYCTYPEKIQVIPNGVELLPNERSMDDKIYSEPDNNNAPIIIGCVGRFVKEKRYCDVFEAARILHAQRKNVHFLLVGGRGDIGLYEKQLDETGLGEVITLTGEVENPLDYIKDFDIFLMTSSAEGMPNSLMEAMALGKPIVATNVGAIPELVTPHSNGILVPIGNPGIIADALTRLAENRALIDQFGRASLHKIADYSVERMAVKYDKLYENIISRQN